MKSKELYRKDLSEEEATVIRKYLISRLENSSTFDKTAGYWYDQSEYKVHFVLIAVTSNVRLQLAEKACKTFSKNYSDLNKFFEISAIYDDFNTDLVFELRKDVDLTYLYGLARMVCGERI